VTYFNRLLYSYHGKNRYSREHPQIRGLKFRVKNAHLLYNDVSWPSRKATVKCEVSDSNLQKYSCVFYAYNMARIEYGLTSK
jgi:hypothetical protein